MNLLYKYTNTLIKFQDGKVNLLVVEDTRLISKLLRDLHNQINGLDDNFILSEGSDDFNFKKNVLLINDIFNLSFNDKKVTNLIISKATAICNDYENMEETNILLTSIEKYILNIIENIEYPVLLDTIQITNLLKSLRFTIDDNFDSQLEKIIAYIKMINEFSDCKLFILINLKLYFTSEELESLYKELTYLKINVLLIEKTLYNKISKYENTTIIDKDYCEISY